MLTSPPTQMFAGLSNYSQTAGSHIGETVVKIEIEVHEDTLPAFYSAIEEVSNSVGTRLTESKLFAREDALTRAARALGALRAGIAKAHRELAASQPASRRWNSPLGDPDYR